MPDREKLIKGLDEIQKRFAQSLELRHEYDPDDDAVVDIIYKADIDLLRDALQLLKEQEAVEPIKPIDVDDSFTYLCSNCKGELFCGDRIRDKYCPTCGRLVKWE